MQSKEHVRWEMEADQSRKVTTIGGKGHLPAGLGAVKWSWNNDHGQTHKYLVGNFLFFPQSSINILSVTEFT
jgi:hypothetical protein